MNAVTTTGVVTDFQGLQALKRTARETPEQAIKEVATQFEAMFVQMMLKSMRDASFGDSLFGSHQMESYQGMFDSQIALHLSQGRGIGLSDTLARQFRGAANLSSGDEVITPGDKDVTMSLNTAGKVAAYSQHSETRTHFTVTA